MSALSEAQYGRAVIREGAKGYHGKSSNLEELARAVRIVLAGRRYVSAALAEIMASDLDSKLDPHRPQHEREKMGFTSNADITA